MAAAAVVAKLMQKQGSRRRYYGRKNRKWLTGGGDCSYAADAVVLARKYTAGLMVVAVVKGAGDDALSQSVDLAKGERKVEGSRQQRRSRGRPQRTKASE